MIASNHSESEEGENTMSPLKLSPGPLDKTSNKRLRTEHSEDETEDLPNKKQKPCSTPEILKENNENSDKNGIEHNAKKKTVLLDDDGDDDDDQDVDDKSLSESNTHKENEEKQNNLEKQENENESHSPKTDSNHDGSPDQITKEGTKEEDNPSKDTINNTNTELTSEDDSMKMKETHVNMEKEEDNKTIDEKAKNEEDGNQKRGIKKRKVDSEIVDGLELSVECASDKEESSSESEHEKDVQPRPKTIIIKAKPNESELECSSSEDEKSSSQETIDAIDTKTEKKGKKRSLRANFSKLKTESGSEDSNQKNNSDEDYSPRNKKKIKKTPTTKKAGRRSIELKKGRGGARRNSQKKDIEHTSDTENEDTSLAEKDNKIIKTTDDTKEELSDKESSTSKSENDSNSEDEETYTKGRKGRHSNSKPEDRQIELLKKYLKTAGIRIRCYKDILADCKSTSAKIKRLKELLEKNGVTGRPSLEKCKRVKEENEKLREVSELDTSNIISEGRITRARRNMVNKKVISTETPERHREARNTYKRIQTVVDSDSE